LAASVACLVFGSAAATAFGVRANHLAGQRQLALEQLTVEEGKTRAALERVTMEKRRTQDALEQAREAIDVTTDEVLINLLSKQQEFGEREKEFLRKTLAQQQRLAATEGDDAPEDRFARANGLYRCGAIRHRLGELDESIAAGRAAIAIYRKLVEDVPDHSAYARRLAVALANIAVVLNASGKPEEAIAACREARDTLAPMAVSPRAQPELLVELSGAHGNLGNLYAMTRNPIAAETSIRAAIAIDRELAAAHPDNTAYRKRLAASLQNFGLLLSQRNRMAEAETALRDAQTLQRDLPQEPDLRQQLSLGYFHLGNVYQATSRLPAAQAALESARDLQAGLAAEFPSAPDYRQQLSTTLWRLATVLRDRGQTPQAIDAARQAVEIREKLAATFARHDYLYDLAAARNSLGTMLLRTGTLKEAGQVYTAALADWKKLVAETPQNPEHANGLAGVMVNLGLIRLRENDAAGARRLAEDAGPYHAAAMKAMPQHLDYRRYYRNNRELLLHVTLALGDHAAAAAAAEDFVRCEIKPVDDPYYAACGLARCAALAEKDESLPTPKRTAVATAYADRAIAHLRVAVVRGLRDAPGLKRERDLDPIRGRSDFQAILKGMDEKPKK
jgi:tetratricopeptide (TPR) repeat protein